MRRAPVQLNKTLGPASTKPKNALSVTGVGGASRRPITLIEVMDMFKKNKKTLAASVACIFILGLAAYAQTQAGVRRPNKRPGVTKQQMIQRRDGQLRETAQRRPRYGLAFLNLQRFLRPPSPMQMRRLAAAVGLTEEQKEQIKQLYRQFLEASRPIMEQRGAAVREFLAAWQSPSVSKGQLQSLSQPILQADRDILDAEFDFWLGLREILNAEQQTKFGQYMEMRALQSMKGTPGDRGGVPPAPAP